ncbi:hypothetical protein [Peribacillus kribbensis]|uniref:hypothetical protein n=1 Tax=Peribacillus kribbensis TaxID=356658 RepID=UPI000402D7EF|nr:hypothetical protein [Peribacillus kribbensis]
MNPYLTMKELKDLLPDIPENSLKRYLIEHEEYLNFKKEHNRYRVHVSEVEKIKLIRKFYSEGLKKEEVNSKLEESGVRVTITYDPEENKSLVSVNQEMEDMKRLMSFLVQQNEQARMNQNKIKSQNKDLLREIQEMKEIIKEVRGTQEEERQAQAETFSSLYDSLLETKKSLQETAVYLVAEKNKISWRSILRKLIP